MDGAGRPLPEAVEPHVTLTRLKDGREVVEDYRSVGLSLRRHPVSFLRETLTGMGMTTFGALGRTRDGRRVAVPGLVLMRQKPGTAKGVLFITIEGRDGRSQPHRLTEHLRETARAGRDGGHDCLPRTGAA